MTSCFLLLHVFSHPYTHLRFEEMIFLLVSSIFMKISDKKWEVLKHRGLQCMCRSREVICAPNMSQSSHLSHRKSGGYKIEFREEGDGRPAIGQASAVRSCSLDTYVILTSASIGCRAAGNCVGSGGAWADSPAPLLR